MMQGQERLTVARYTHRQLMPCPEHRFWDVRMDMRRSTNGRTHYYLTCRVCERARRRKT